LGLSDGKGDPVPPVELRVERVLALDAA
jgi:hypothetical protein